MVKFQSLEYKGNTLRGFLYEPDCDYDTLIVAYHGFNGSTSSMYLLYSEMAKILVENKIGVLMFDFLGSGNSDLTFEETLVSDQISQAKHIQDYAKTFDKKIVTMGHSLGGFVCRKALDNSIDKCILLAPAIDNTIFNDMEGIEYIYGVKLHENFFSDFKNINNDLEYDNSVLIIHGMSDDITPPFPVSIFASEHDNVEFLGLEDMEHFFLDYHNREYMIETIINFVNGNEY